MLASPPAFINRLMVVPEQRILHGSDGYDRPALEGGGARGAFHMGVVKAFLEEGYEIGGITGTSIGALNGAIVQGS